MMRRHALTDEQWQALDDLFLPPKTAGSTASRGPPGWHVKSVSEKSILLI